MGKVGWLFRDSGKAEERKGGRVDLSQIVISNAANLHDSPGDLEVAICDLHFPVRHLWQHRVLRPLLGLLFHHRVLYQIRDWGLGIGDWIRNADALRHTQKFGV